MIAPDPGVNRATPDPGPRLHDLTARSRIALSSMMKLYEAVVADYDRVHVERIAEIDQARQEGQFFLDMLHEIAELLPAPKNDDETLAQAMHRYVGELKEKLEFERGKTVGATFDLRSAFRELCQAHSITVPCDSFVGVAEESPTCGGCGHPYVVHPPPPAGTEATS